MPVAVAMMPVAVAMAVSVAMTMTVAVAVTATAVAWGRVSVLQRRVLGRRAVTEASCSTATAAHRE